MKGNFQKLKKMKHTIFAHDNGPYIGLYTARSCKTLCGAVWKDNKRCIDEWEEIKKTHKIEWV